MTTFHSPLALYIHIPFCRTICPYCDFATWKSAERHHPRWLEAVIREIRARIPEGTALGTLYWGGGTPSELSEEATRDLFTFLRAHFFWEYLEEFTVEANPNSIPGSRMTLYIEKGVTRLSLGVQSFQPDLLRRLGRSHTRDEARDAIRRASQHTWSVSADLMFGTPGQTRKDWQKDLEILCQEPLQHVSLYGLTLEKNTLYHQQHRRGELPELPEEEYDAMYLEAVAAMEDRGWVRYEVSNFAYPGEESRHNKTYWNHGEYVGVGAGAHSLIGNTRWAAPGKFADYERWVREGCPPLPEVMESLSPVTRYNEALWLGLRQTAGVDMAELRHRYGKTPDPKKLDYYLEKGWMERHGDSQYRLKDRGWLYLDGLCSDLMEALR